MDLSNIEVEINPDYTMKKRINGNLYLSQEEIDILKSFNVNYSMYSSLSDLIYELETLEEEVSDDVLSNIIDVLSERNYYENFKK